MIGIRVIITSNSINASISTLQLRLFILQMSFINENDIAHSVYLLGFENGLSTSALSTSAQFVDEDMTVQHVQASTSISQNPSEYRIHRGVSIDINQDSEQQIRESSFRNPPSQIIQELFNYPDNQVSIDTCQDSEQSQQQILETGQGASFGEENVHINQQIQYSVDLDAGSSNRANCFRFYQFDNQSTIIENGALTYISQNLLTRRILQCDHNSNILQLIGFQMLSEYFSHKTSQTLLIDKYRIIDQWKYQAFQAFELAGIERRCNLYQ